MDAMEKYFIIGIFLTILALILIAFLGSNTIATAPGEITEGHAQIQDVDVSVKKVPGDTVDLKTITRIQHRGGLSRNLSVLVRAASLNGILETKSTKKLDAVKGDKEVEVTNNLTVEREGGYRIDTILYKEGRRVDMESKRVDGVGNLQPNFATSTVKFHRFQTHPPIEYSIQNVEGNTVTLGVTSYLTNTGNRTGDLRLILKARQSDSNIIANQKQINIGSIERGNTKTPTTTLTVPDGYNYYLDGILWNGSSIIAEQRSVANLHPTKTIDLNQTIQEIGIEVSDFETQQQRPPPQPTSQQQESQPGFGVIITVLAITILVVTLYFRKNE